MGLEIKKIFSFSAEAVYELSLFSIHVFSNLTGLGCSPPHPIPQQLAAAAVIRDSRNRVHQRDEGEEEEV